MADKIEQKEVDIQIDGLIDQLKNNTALMKAPQAAFQEVRKEDAETFVVKQAGELINQSLDLVKDLKVTAFASKDSEEIEAVAKLIAATAAALEALNKIIIQDKKTTAAKELKRMDVESKEKDTTKDGQIVLKGTREEIFKQLVKEADIIDVTPIEDSQTK